MVTMDLMDTDLREYHGPRLRAIYGDTMDTMETNDLAFLVMGITQHFFFISLGQLQTQTNCSPRDAPL